MYTGFLLGLAMASVTSAAWEPRRFSVSVMFSVMVTPLSVLLLELSELSLELSP